MSLIDLLKSRRSADAQPSSAAAASVPFQSTRSAARATAPEAVLRGLAPDGGLYVDPQIASGTFDVWTPSASRRRFSPGCCPASAIWAPWCAVPMKAALPRMR